ncbi:hypothetical protein QJS83_11535 [Bdellovibrio sp. 22V]|uniref:hypothetical protein n=1 Tax=Bdellovibrio TaxID=958 RepID=UPI002542B796|nr:hypothetical protein [Bdellovibrio sp. 22V]WII71093.1 hypothetical protein QJS83_11535 [Bdellovibrio sp. 22V]
MLHGSHVFDPQPRGRWSLLHILDPESLQSQDIQKYLIGRGAHASYDEIVILLKPAPLIEKDLKDKGFIVTLRSSEEAEQNFPALTPPYFLVSSPRGEGVFVGPYGNKIQDLKIVESFYSNKTLSTFPISGCGNSVRAQKFFDPQGILLANKEGL